MVIVNNSCLYYNLFIIKWALRSVIYMLFSEKLKKLRKENGLTQEDLAFKLNVSRQAITKWECDEGIPDIENLKQISILFGVSIDELVKEDKDVNVDIKKQFQYLQ